MKILKSWALKFDPIVTVVGMRTLCWNNFGNNRMAKELRIIPE